MEEIPNVLAQRYASSPMAAIWSPKGKIRMERYYWLAVLKAQRELGLPVADEAITAYEACLDNIDLAAMDERERLTRHDVKARLEIYNEAAGHEQLHKGMTSRDLTENVEQLQVYRSLELILPKSLAVLHWLALRAQEWADVVISGRTHNVAAQPTTMGKRMAMFGEELLQAVERLHALLSAYPARGLKGAVGTQLDIMTLFAGDRAKVAELETLVLGHLGLPCKLECVGQVYPRSIDFEVVSCAVQLASGPASFARTLRLMAGHELASEGFAKGQVGSSAMPHKMNARSCERINGLHTLLKGYLAMAAGLTGDQWNEGDVSCSVVRRVMLPDTFFAVDGLLETCLTVLQQMGIFPAVIERENAAYLPFLSTTTLLMEAVKRGAGRETAHAAIKQHALATVHDLRDGARADNNLAERLADDPRIGLSRAEIDAVFANADALCGNAQAQVDSFVARTRTLLDPCPEAAAYTPESIL